MSDKDDGLDGMDLGDDFDLGDLDMDFDDGMSEDLGDVNPGDRSAVASVIGDSSKSFVEGFTDDKAQTLLDIGRAAIPTALSKETDIITSGYSTIKDEVTKQGSKLKREAKQSLRAFKRFLPENEDGFLNKIVNKASSLLGDDESRVASSGPTQAEQIASEITNLMGAKQEASVYQEQFKEQLAFTRQQELKEIQATESVNVERIRKFLFEVSDSFYRTSLNVSLRHLYSAEELLAVTKSGFDIFKTSLAAIIKNTGLPEVVKIRETELAGQMIKQKMFDAVGTSLFKSGTPIDRIVAKATSTVKDYSESAASVLQEATGAAEQAGSLGEGGISKGGLIGGLIADYAKQKAGKMITEQLSKQSGSAQAIWDAKNDVADPREAFKKYGKGEGLLAGAARTLHGMAGSGESNFSVEQSDPNSAAYIDNRTKDSINKIIPQLLSKIYGEVKTSRELQASIAGTNLKKQGISGPESKELIYDPATSEFVTRATLKKTTHAKFKKDAYNNVSKPANELTKLFLEGSEEEFSREDTKVIRDAAIKTILDKGVTSADIFKDDYFLDLIKETDPKLLSRVKKQHTVYLERAKVKGSSIQDDSLRYIEQITISKSKHQQIAKDFVDRGLTKEAVDLGLLTRNEDGSLIGNRDAIKADIIGKAGTADITTTVKDKTSTLKDELKGKSKFEQAKIIAKRTQEDLEKKLSGKKDVNKESDLGSFDEGGYTEDGNEDEVAGIVHREEYVLSKKKLNKIIKAVKSSDSESILSVVSNLVKDVIKQSKKYASVTDNITSKLDTLVDKEPDSKTGPVETTPSILDQIAAKFTATMTTSIDEVGEHSTSVFSTVFSAISKSLSTSVSKLKDIAKILPDVSIAGSVDAAKELYSGSKVEAKVTELANTERAKAIKDQLVKTASATRESDLFKNLDSRVTTALDSDNGRYATSVAKNISNTVMNATGSDVKNKAVEVKKASSAKVNDLFTTTQKYTPTKISNVLVHKNRSDLTSSDIAAPKKLDIVGGFTKIGTSAKEKAESVSSEIAKIKIPGSVAAGVSSIANKVASVTNDKTGEDETTETGFLSKLAKRVVDYIPENLKEDINKKAVTLSEKPTDKNKQTTIGEAFTSVTDKVVKQKELLAKSDTGKTIARNRDELLEKIMTTLNSDSVSDKKPTESTLDGDALLTAVTDVSEDSKNLDKVISDILGLINNNPTATTGDTSDVDENDPVLNSENKPKKSPVNNLLSKAEAAVSGINIDRIKGVFKTKTDPEFIGPPEPTTILGSAKNVIANAKASVDTVVNKKVDLGNTDYIDKSTFLTNVRADYANDITSENGEYVSVWDDLNEKEQASLRLEFFTSDEYRTQAITKFPIWLRDFKQVDPGSLGTRKGLVVESILELRNKLLDPVNKLKKELTDELIAKVTGNGLKELSVKEDAAMLKLFYKSEEYQKKYVTDFDEWLKPQGMRSHGKSVLGRIKRALKPSALFKKTRALDRKMMGFVGKQVLKSPLYAAKAAMFAGKTVVKGVKLLRSGKDDNEEKKPSLISKILKKTRSADKVIMKGVVKSPVTIAKTVTAGIGKLLAYFKNKDTTEAKKTAKETKQAKKTAKHDKFVSMFAKDTEVAEKGKKPSMLSKILKKGKSFFNPTTIMLAIAGTIAALGITSDDIKDGIKTTVTVLGTVKDGLVKTWDYFKEFLNFTKNTYTYMTQIPDRLSISIREALSHVYGLGSLKPDASELANLDNKLPSVGSAAQPNTDNTTSETSVDKPSTGVNGVDALKVVAGGYVARKVYNGGKRVINAGKSVINVGKRVYGVGEKVVKTTSSVASKVGGTAAKIASKIPVNNVIPKASAEKKGIAKKLKAFLGKMKSRIIKRVGRTAGAKLLAKIASRFVPFVGWALLIYDAGKLIYNLTQGDSFESAASKAVLGVDLFDDEQTDTPLKLKEHSALNIEQDKTIVIEKPSTETSWYSNLFSTDKSTDKKNQPLSITEGEKHSNLSVSKDNVGGTGVIPVDTTPIVPGSEDSLTLGPRVTVNGLRPPVLENLLGMASEYKDKTGDKMPINSGYRSTEYQRKLKAKFGAAAASPGHSTHEFGIAIDTNSKVADNLENLGLMRKYGFTRPIGGEKWHLEPAGVQTDVNRAKRDPNFADQATRASVYKGGGGLALVDGARKYSRNKKLQLAAFDAPDKRVNGVKSELPKSNVIDIATKRPKVTLPDLPARDATSLTTVSTDKATTPINSSEGEPSTTTIPKVAAMDNKQNTTQPVINIEPVITVKATVNLDDNKDLPIIAAMTTRAVDLQTQMVSALGTISDKLDRNLTEPNQIKPSIIEPMPTPAVDIRRRASF